MMQLQHRGGIRRNIRVRATGDELHFEIVAQRRYAANPAVIGKALGDGDVRYTIVGVMPESFEPPRFGWLGQQDVWFPFEPGPHNLAWGRSLLVIARLYEGVSIETARSELIGIASQLELETEANRGWSASLVSLEEQVAGHLRAPLLAMLATSGLLVGLAFTNVAMLASGFIRRRQHEITMRRALGASDGRLVSQLLVQNGLLAVCGVALGTLAAAPVLATLRRTLPGSLPRLESVALDAAAAMAIGAFTVAAVLFATFVVAWWTAPKRHGRSLASVMRAVEPVPASVLIVAEVALSLAIGITALLTVRSASELQAVDIGFDTSNLVVARVALPETVTDRERQWAVYEAILDRVRHIGGVQSASVISTRPFGGLGPATAVRDARVARSDGSDGHVADLRYADMEIFQTLRVPVIARRETAASLTHAAISESLAHALWPNQTAVGQRLHLSQRGGIDATVVAVVGDVHLMDRRTSPRGSVYLSVAQFPPAGGDVVVRATDPNTVIPLVRAAVASVDPDMPVYEVDRVDRIVAASSAAERATGYILSAFAAMALALLAVGVFGVFAGEAAARRREIGVRLALGGCAIGIVALFLQRALTHAAVGLGVGLVLALVVSHAMAPFLFGVSPWDPASFGIASALIVVVAFASTALPAWRALGGGPLTILRDS